MGNTCGSKKEAAKEIHDDQQAASYKTPQEEVVCLLPDPTSQIPAALGDLSLAPPESLEWLNVFLKDMWPTLELALQKKIKGDLKPQIDEKVPGFMKGKIEISLSLGEKVPCFGKIQMFKGANQIMQSGPKLHVGINFDSDIALSLSWGILKIGANKLRLNGTMIVAFDWIEHLPVIGGTTIYFIDPPDIEIPEWSGIADILDFPPVRSLIRNFVDSWFSDHLVVPNAYRNQSSKDGARFIGRKMHTSEINLAMSRDPSKSLSLDGPQGASSETFFGAMLPIGMLRIRVLACSGQSVAGGDYFGKAEPYVRVRLGRKTLNVEINRKEGIPKAGVDSVEDFEVFDGTQRLLVDVFDDDCIFDDNLGRVQPMYIGEAVNASNKDLPVTLNDGKTPNGIVRLEAQWLQAFPGELGTEGCLVVLRIINVTMPRSWGDSCAMRMRIGQKKSVSTVQEHVKFPEGVDKDTVKQNLDLLQRLQPEAQQAEIAKVRQEVDKLSECVGCISFDLQYVLSQYVPVELASQMETEVVLTIVEGIKEDSKELATLRIPLGQLAAEKSMHISKPEGEWFHTKDQGSAVAMLDMMLLGLKRQRVNTL